MKFYNWLIKYRFWIGIIMLLLGVAANLAFSFWPSFPLYLIGVLLIAGHFFFGPLRLIQEYMESGNMDGAEKSDCFHSVPKSFIQAHSICLFHAKRQFGNDETGL